ncbi:MULTISPECIES: RICIN domain-containing protein [unclassified Streptomyces]|uniref:RICIN domain-containing protein n=1 Tax=unclassified Streptomyces TaxID=2593676 RepID=UPI001BEB646B|nr:MULTISPECIES: RICIN domain-containing protein [unclassified Streptomyces]MBT2406486.1 RICIN domain-containing protein [Streptomyces sp. ISL-21]MBT2458777.1 RICIN domain-containing protein [Streptomyces sp. ISL-86]MBT2613742.1 RICIN domain-containing protein [Streptomyces sp. ISL-87]
MPNPMTRRTARLAALSSVALAQSLVVGPGPAHAAVQYYEIRSPSNMCLSVAASSLRDGADVIQWNCLGATDQRWRLTNVADRPAGKLEHGLLVKIRAQHSDKCLAVAQDSLELGADTVQADCGDMTTTATWWLNGSGDLYSIEGEHCVSVEHASARKGADVVQGDCEGSSRQKWRFTPWE